MISAKIAIPPLVVNSVPLMTIDLRGKKIAHKWTKANKPV